MFGRRLLGRGVRSDRKKNLMNALFDTKRCVAVVLAVTGILVLAIPAAAGLSPVAFADAASYAAGSFPYGLDAGNFNGDLKPDLVTTNLSGGDVSVLLNDGDGAFAPAVNYRVGSLPSSVTVGDFNGDARDDVAATNVGSGDVSVLLNNGDGSFAAAISYSVGGSPSFVATGEFNGDAQADLVVANFVSGGVSLLMGNGDGTFSTGNYYATGTNPRSLVIGDFNNDGKADLAVANDDYPAGIVSVLLGNGDGTFVAAVNYSMPQYRSYAYSIAAGDVNGDAKADLVVAGGTNANGDVVFVALNNGDGSFGAFTGYSSGGLTPGSVAISDFNDDGKADLAVLNWGLSPDVQPNVSVLVNNGDGTFTGPAFLHGVSNPHTVVVADFNGDSWTDLALSDGGSNTVTVLLALDAVPPTMTCSAMPNTLRPPNHKLAAITVSVTVADDPHGTGANGFKLVSVTSSQPDSGLGEDDAPNDVQGWTTGTADTIGQLRAERYGTSRTYTLTYEGSDHAGNTAQCVATVAVPLNSK
jgi:hypothetical protein